jgi:hypothetical protein
MGEIIPDLLYGPCPNCIDDLPDELHAEINIPGVGYATGSLLKVDPGVYHGVLHGDGELTVPLDVYFCFGTGTEYNCAYVEQSNYFRALPPPAISGSCFTDYKWGAGCEPLGGYTTVGCGYAIGGGPAPC